MQFLIDRGIDMTIIDYRWRSTAQGWARYAANDEKMAQWLEDAERNENREDEHVLWTGTIVLAYPLCLLTG